MLWRAELRRLPVDFGIGVSAGPVFAGNIGAENRYEYTVVGDAVNEAARLADRAKEFDGRVLCSHAAIEGADDAERRKWTAHGSDVSARPLGSDQHVRTGAGSANHRLGNGANGNAPLWHSLMRAPIPSPNCTDLRIGR